MAKFFKLSFLAALLAWAPTQTMAQGIRGTATFTGRDHTGGTCSLANYTLPAGISGTGIGPSNWAQAGKCGSCIQVNGPRGSTKVMVCIEFLALLGWREDQPSTCLSETDCGQLPIVPRESLESFRRRVQANRGPRRWYRRCNVRCGVLWP